MRRTTTFLVAIGVLALAGCAGRSSTTSVLPDASARLPQSVDSAATKLKCFSGTTDNSGFGGTCTLTPTGAVLNTAANGGGYAGVFISSTNNLKFRPLAQVDTMSFNFSGDAATNGSPRFSVAYTTDNGATTNEAFVSAFFCNDGTGHVDIHNASCLIFTSTSINAFPTWAAFVAANPTGRLNGIPFVIADDPGHTWTVTNVSISK